MLLNTTLHVVEQPLHATRLGDGIKGVAVAAHHALSFDEHVVDPPFAFVASHSVVDRDLDVAGDDGGIDYGSVALKLLAVDANLLVGLLDRDGVVMAYSISATTGVLTNVGATLPTSDSGANYGYSITTTGTIQ